MREYIYDYNKDSFIVVIKKDGTKQYQLKSNNDYIVVSEKIFKVCKSSYDKIRYDSKMKVDRSILNYEDIDQSTFFVVNKKIETDPVRDIYISDLAQKAKSLIKDLEPKYKDIAICVFINEMSISETAAYLNIPNTTVYDRKIKIQKYLKKQLKNPNDF